MGLRLTDRRGIDALERLLKISEKLPQMAATVQAESLGMAVTAAQANIYSTAPGAYQRTGEYLRSLNASARATKSRVTVKVWSDSEYAAAIEYGRDKVSPAMLQALALKGPVNAPATLGRSGQTWWIAGPVLTSAQVYAARRLRQLVLKEVLAAWR